MWKLEDTPPNCQDATYAARRRAFMRHWREEHAAEVAAKRKSKRRKSKVEVAG